jgi:hypothetical protein
MSCCRNRSISAQSTAPWRPVAELSPPLYLKDHAGCEQAEGSPKTVRRVYSYALLRQSTRLPTESKRLFKLLVTTYIHQWRHGARLRNVMPSVHFILGQVIRLFITMGEYLVQTVVRTAFTMLCCIVRSL